MSKLKGCAMASFLVLLAGCQATPMEVAHRNLTSGEAKKKIETGKTSQAEVVRALGAPNMVLAKSGAGEVWTYDQISVLKQQGAVQAGAFLFSTGPWSDWTSGAGVGAGGGGSSETSSVRTVTLVIEFDDKGVVKSYEMLATAF